MKKIAICTSLVLTMIMLSSFSSAQNSDDQVLISRAKAAIRQECNVTGPLEAGKVQIISICFVDGFVKRVSVFVKAQPCPGNELNCVVRPLYLGYVEFACGNQPSAVVCAQ